MMDTDFASALGTLSQATLTVFASAAASLVIADFCIMAPQAEWHAHRRTPGLPAPRRRSRVATICLVASGTVVILILALAQPWVIPGPAGIVALVAVLAVLMVPIPIAYVWQRRSRDCINASELADRLAPTDLNALLVRDHLRAYETFGAFLVTAAMAAVALARGMMLGDGAQLSVFAIGVPVLMAGGGSIAAAGMVDPLSWLAREYVNFHRPRTRHRAFGPGFLSLDPAALDFAGRRSSWNDFLRAADIRLHRLVARHAEPDRSSHRRGCGSYFDELEYTEPTSELARKVMTDLMVAAVVGRLPKSTTEPRHALGCNRPRWFGIKAILGAAAVVIPLGAQVASAMKEVM